jgi:TP901 family phage tail tape measure protein
MAGRFVLTAQLQVQAPTNLTQVRRQIQQQLSNVTINPQINTQALANFQNQLNNTNKAAQNANKNLRNASRSASSLGASLGAAARRFASITLATGAFLALARGISEAFGRAIEFERELIKISQVTGKSVSSLKGLTAEVTRLSTSLGASSAELLNASRTLSQAGFSATKAKQALEILAQTDLGATFENIADTTEGAIALLRQFRKEAAASGGDIAFLGKSIDAITAVSKNFAVEASDLIAVIRRTGGVFEAAGGKINELIALFTSVRGTTRETAETIATGFRTIFTRIQRTETIDQLRELGIVLQDSSGKFVGPLEAIRKLSLALGALDPRDFRFSQIVEQLGGFRQVGKVIPLIKQYSTSAEALAIANNSMGETARDAQKAQQGLGVEFQKLGEKFNATIRRIADSDTFQSLARGAIQLAEAVLKVVDALEPLLPMLTALAAFSLGRIALPALGRFSGVTGRNKGGRIYGFNQGGLVPGVGNKDTVPARLTAGEYVLQKSAVQRIGVDNLAAMNAGMGYNAGGTVTGGRNFYGNPAGGSLFQQAARTQRGLKKPATAGTTQAGQPVDMGRLRRAISTSSISFALAGGKAPGGLSLNPAQKGGFYTMSKARSLGQNGLPLSSLSRDAYGALASAVSARHPAVKRKDVDMVRKGGGRLKGSLMGGMKFPVANIQSEGLRTAVSDNLEKYAKQYMGEGVSDTLKSLKEETKTAKLMKAAGLKITKKDITRATKATRRDDQAVDSMVGFMFEGAINGLTGAQPATGRASFDIPKGSMRSAASGMKGLFGAQTSKMLMAEVKKNKKKFASIPSKLSSFIESNKTTSQSKTGLRYKNIKVGAYNRGGQVDTVPAVLTPGEYVFTKSAAEAIGYDNLDRMNKTGVAHFNAGGMVGGTVRAGKNYYGLGHPGVSIGGTRKFTQAQTQTNMPDKQQGGGNLAMLAMLGATAASTAVQMSGLEESTANAASQFFMLAGMMAPMAFELVKTVAGLQMFEAKLAASGRTAGGIAMKFALVVAGAALVKAVFDKFAADNKKIVQGNRDIISGMAEGKGAAKSMQELREETLAASKMAGRQSAAGTGALGGAALGAAIGSFIPVIGTVVGGIIGGVVGGAMGFAEGGESSEEAQSLAGVTDAAYLAAQAIGNYSNAQAEINRQQLEGIDRLKAQNKATSQFNQESSKAGDAFAKIAAIGVDEDLMGFDSIKEGFEQAKALAEEQGKVSMQAASDTKSSLDSVSQEFLNNGQSAKELFANPDFKQGMLNYVQSLEKGYAAQLLASGVFREQAEEAAKLTENFDQLSKAEQEAKIIQEEAAMIQAKASKDARDAGNKYLKSIQDQSDANEKARKEAAQRAAQRAAVERLLAQKAQAAADALAKFEQSAAMMDQAMKNMDIAMGNLTGTVKRHKVENDKLIAGIAKGNVTASGSAALTQIGKDFGLEDEAKAINNILKRERAVREKLVAGIGKFGGLGGEAGSKENIKKFVESAGINFDGLSDEIQAEIETKFRDGIDAADIEAVMKLLKTPVDAQVKVFQKLAQLQNQYLDRLDTANQAILKAKTEFRKSLVFENKVRVTGIRRLFKALGKEVGVREERQIQAMEVGARTRPLGVAPNRTAIVGGIAARNARLQQLRTAGADGGVGGVAAANEMRELQAETKVLKEALKELTDQTKIAEAIFADLEKEREKRGVMQDQIKDFTFATNEGRREMTQNFMALNRVLQTGDLNAIPDKFRGAVGQLLDQFKDIPIFQGQTGGDISKRLQIQQLDRQFRFASGGRQGVPPELVKAIFEATTKEEKLIDDLRKLNQEEQQAAQALTKIQSQENTLLIENMKMLINQIKLLVQAFTAQAKPAAKKANGGLIYRAGGGSIFQPRGTDTVPAMLTPGEFVIRKSAVDKIGVGALTALNNGNASTVYRANGGFVGSTSGGALSFAASLANIMLADPRKLNETALFKTASQDGKKKGLESLRNFAKAPNFGNSMLGNIATIVRVAGALGDPRLGLVKFGRIDQPGNPKLGDFATLLSEAGGLLSIQGGGMNPSLKLNPAFRKNARLVAVPQARRDAYEYAGTNPTAMQLLNNPATKDQAQQAILAHAFLKNSKNPSVIGGRALAAGASITGPQRALIKQFFPQLWANTGGLLEFLTSAEGQAKKGVGALGAFNNKALQGQGFFARGGSVDSVPAMLTPGEFVMSRAAVKKHGTGFMNSVNRGKIPGFARGGSVGGVQYRQNGGAIGGMGQNMMDAIAKSLSIFDNLAGMLNNRTYKYHIQYKLTEP